MNATSNGGRSAARTWAQDRKVRAARAETAIEELRTRRSDVAVPPSGCGAAEWVAYNERQALLSAQLAGWWTVLARTSVDVPFVFRSAALQMRHTERDRARDHRARSRRWAERVTANKSVAVTR